MTTRTTTKLRIVRKPPARSAEREKLAEAVANHAAATRGISNARAALARAVAFRTDAVARLEKAKVSVEKAKDKAVASAVGKAAGGAPGADALRLARQAEIDATDALEVAREAIAECEEKLVQYEKDLQWAEPQLANAVDRVIAAECGASVLEEARKLQEALFAKRLELRAMAMSGQMQGDLLADANRPLFDCMLPSGNGTPFSPQWRAHPAQLRWEQMRADLAKDADAETPGGSR
jgi:hypothetical protein